MRNLKKILALALALVMTLSVMTVANAAFTDSKDINADYNEAVEVLSGLGVFKGTGTGSTFSPKQSITRAEVAAIIYRIATGDVKDTQVGIYADYAKFKDVKSTAWYAGYVGYCANAELIKGDGKGNWTATVPQSLNPTVVVQVDLEREALGRQRDLAFGVVGDVRGVAVVANLGGAVLRLHHNPLAPWIWLGGAIMALGGGLDITGTCVTSWNEAKGTADEEYRNGRSYLLARDGKTTVLAPGPALKKLAVNDLDAAAAALILEQFLARVE